MEGWKSSANKILFSHLNLKRVINCIRLLIHEYEYRLFIMNEGYMCNTCKVGKVRPIQFSLKQAIVNCDNLDCDSYLEKWPWECVITRPILNSSDLCKYEKDSTCSSSDSSGVHSDLGSSGVSQYSVTDREVETLLQKSYTSDFDFEGVDKSQHTLQWQSGTTIQEQEPFVALDDKMFSTDMPSHDSENFFENKYNLFVNSFQSEEESRNINARNRHGLTSLLSDTDLGGSSSISTSQEKDTHVDNDLESWLCKLEPSELLENSIQDNCNNKWQLENGDSSYLSPSKTLIPSLNSAFSEVSPSKLNLFPFQNIKTHESLETLKGNDINTRTKESSVQNPFLSPVSSGFNEDCGDHSTSKTLSSTELSLPNYLSALEIQSSPKSSTPEEKEDTIKPSEEVCSTTIETQTKPKLLSEEKKENTVAQPPISLNNNQLGRRRRTKKVPRNETKCKSEVVTDPWSVSEMYIDELNIEVVLKNESTSSSPFIAEHEVIRPGQHSRLSNPALGTEENASHSDPLDLNLDQNAKNIEDSVMVSHSNFSTLSDLGQSQCQEVTEFINLAPKIDFSPKLISNQQSDLHKPTQDQSESIDSAPQVVDLYKPVTLKPEVIDYDHEYFDASTPSFSDTSKLRLSVGYKTNDNQSDYHSLSETDEIENAECPNTSSKYFSSLLSNIDFDENFCLLVNKEKESSLENLFSSKFLSSDSDSEGFGFENNDNNNNNGVKENNLSSPVKDEIFTEVKEEEALDPLADVSFKSEEYMSESELPVVTVDENDDLKLYVPIKNEIIEEKELNLWSHNLISIQDYSRRKKIGHKNLGSSKIKKRSAIHSQLPPNYCGNSLNVIDTQDHLYSRPSLYNLNFKSFTMGRRHEKFGDLKKEPEFFETYLSDHDDSKDRLSSLEQSNSPVDFLCEMNEREDFEMCGIENTPKTRTCCKILKNKSYMRQLLNPCRCNSSLNYDFDTSFAKPFNNLPSKKNRRKQNSKNSSKKTLKSSSVSSSLNKNTSVPDVLNMLKESGWIVTPCSPVINYNVPEHPISPTVVPVPLQNQYGDMGSDMVLWSLTDREVSVPHKKNSVPHNNKTTRENLKSNSIQKYNVDKKNGNSGFDIFSRHKFLKNENQSFSDLNSLCSLEPPPKRKKNELGVDPLCVYNGIGINGKSPLKAFKTNDGSVYIQPCIKKELEENFGNSEESSDSFSEECIELPDDHLAYAEAIRSGFNVSAPPTQLKNVYIPPLPLKQTVKRGSLTKENVNYANNTTKYKKVRELKDPIREKAQNELKTIVSERPPNEVPDVVCMNIEGKLYVYHRKDS